MARDQRRTTSGEGADIVGDTAVLGREWAWRALLEGSPDGISVIGSDGTIRYQSPASESLTGYRPEAIVGRSVLEFIHPEDLQGAVEAIQVAVQESAEVHVKEYRWRCADGSWRWFETVGRNLLDDPDIQGFVCVTRDVHQRRRMKERLQESERFHRVLLSRISDAVFLARESGELVFVCPNVRAIFGYDEVDVLDRGGIKGVLGPEFLEHLQGDFDERTNIEWTARDADEEEHELLINVQAIEELRGGTRLVTVRDVTEYRTLERARGQSERRFRELFDRSLDGVYVTTASGRFLEANQALVQLLGHQSREELLATSVPDLYVDPREREELKARLREQGQVRDYPVVLRRADDEGVVHCEITTVVPEGEDDDDPALMGIVRDVTERLSREATLHRLSRAVAQVHDAVLVTDLDGRIEYANPAIETTHGYPVDELLGENVETLERDLVDDTGREELWQTIREGQTWQGTFTNHHPDGSLRTLEATISPIRDEAGKLVNYIALYRDVTREEQLERSLNRSRRMETVGRLTGGIAHHFNNLLTSINGYTELLLGQVAQGSPEREDLSRIKQAAREAATLTRQLVAFSRELQVDLEPLDLMQPVRSAADRLRDRLAGDVALDLDAPAGDCCVEGDADLLEQLVENLLANAGEALPGGGRIQVRVERADLTEAGRCPCGGVEARCFVRLVVSDDGVGMDDETLSRAFEPFFTTKGGGRVGARGAGLGLAACYAIVESHDGHVCAWSHPGEGSRFEVLIPAAEGDGPAV